MPLFSELLKASDGSAIKDVDASLNGKIVALYFSSNWCGACKKFTPLLSVLYDQIKEEAGDLSLEVIFVSSDDSKDDCTEYAKGHPWLMIPFDSTQRQELKQTHGVFAGKEQDDFKDTKRKSGIPTLVIVSSDGTELDLLDCDSDDITKEVETKQAAFLERWKDHVWKPVEPLAKKSKTEEEEEENGEGDKKEEEAAEPENKEEEDKKEEASEDKKEETAEDKKEE